MVSSNTITFFLAMGITSLSFTGASPLPHNVVSSTQVSAQATSAPGEAACAGTTLVTVTRDVTVTVLPTQAASSIEAAPVISTAVEAAPAISSIASPAPAPAPTSPAAAPAPAGNPTTPVPVSRAGGLLRPTDAAESHIRDDAATRAFTSISLRSPSGECLFVDPTAGDFRQNLIPVAVRPCTGSANEKFDLITSGKHNNAVGKTLVVSSLMNGCLNFDDRRAAGDQVLMFSCGGRAAGEGETSDGQTFDYAGGKEVVLTQQKRADPRVCLVPQGGKLGAVQSADCGGTATYTVV